MKREENGPNLDDEASAGGLGFRLLAAHDELAAHQGKETNGKDGFTRAIVKGRKRIPTKDQQTDGSRKSSDHKTTSSIIVVGGKLA